MRFPKSLKILTLTFGLIAIAGACWAAVYAYDKGFTKKWRRLVNNEFNRRGLEVSIGKLTLDPFQGLVARDVEFYQDESRDTLLAAVSRIILDIDIIRLIENEFFINTIDIRNANLSLPIDPEDRHSERLEINRLNARVLMPDDRIEISQARGELHGVRVAVRGSLYKPKPLPAPPPEKPATFPGSDGTTAGQDTRVEAHQLELTRELRQIVILTVKELEKLEFSPSQRPQVDLELAGDLANPETIRATMNVSAGELKRDGYECQEIQARVELAHSNISLEELLIRDGAGELRARGDHRLGTDSITVRLQSSLDLHGLISSFSTHPALGEFVFYESPKLNLEAEIFLPEGADSGGAERPRGLPVKAIGSFHSGMIGTRGMIFDSLRADFGIERERVYFRNIRLAHETGTLTASLLYGPDGMQYEAGIRLDPTVFIPFMKREGTRKFLDKCKFGKESTLYLRAKGAGPELALRSAQSLAEIDARDFHFNGVPIARLEADAEFKGRDQFYRNVRIRREEGIASADSVIYNLDSEIAVINNVRSSVDPAKMTRCFSESIAGHLERYGFSVPPNVTLNGTIDSKGREKTDIVVTFESPGQVTYGFLGKPLPFVNAAASLHYQGDNISAAHIEGELFDGKVATDFSIENLSGEHRYAAQVDVKTVGFHDLVHLYGYPHETEGELTGNFQFQGRGGDRDSIEGKGVAIIVNGDVFAIPLFGPLANVIDGVIPNASNGFGAAREASANFTLKNGVLATNDFEALASAFRLHGEGEVDCDTEAINFDVRMNARGAPGLLLLPVSKLLEYTCEGSFLSDPQWRPKILSGSAPSPAAKKSPQPRLNLPVPSANGEPPSGEKPSTGGKRNRP